MLSRLAVAPRFIPHGLGHPGTRHVCWPRVYRSGASLTGAPNASGGLDPLRDFFPHGSYYSRLFLVIGQFPSPPYLTPHSTPVPTCVCGMLDVVLTLFFPPFRHVPLRAHFLCVQKLSASGVDLLSCLRRFCLRLRSIARGALIPSPPLPYLCFLFEDDACTWLGLLRGFDLGFAVCLAWADVCALVAV